MTPPIKALLLTLACLLCAVRQACADAVPRASSPDWQAVSEGCQSERCRTIIAQMAQGEVTFGGLHEVLIDSATKGCVIPTGVVCNHAIWPLLVDLACEQGDPQIVGSVTPYLEAGARAGALRIQALPLLDGWPCNFPPHLREEVFRTLTRALPGHCIELKELAAADATLDPDGLLAAKCGDATAQARLLARHAHAVDWQDRRKLAHMLATVGTLDSLTALASDVRSAAVETGRSGFGCHDSARGIALEALATAFPSEPLLNAERLRILESQWAAQPTELLMSQQEVYFDRVEAFLQAELSLNWSRPRPNLGLCNFWGDNEWSAALAARHAAPTEPTVTPSPKD